ncbi:MAG: hypothetical protein Q4E53_02955 [Eubacteriales bacterium]|nr:hypothetical protein [Eubacteriales bacterium]
MKAEFLRHEYTWSKNTIGGTIGLGIVSSSSPKNKEQLRELEKMASMAEADYESGVEVELLSYNQDTGFVKMFVAPAPAAEDQRKNKIVFLYQCRDKETTDPAIYCLPSESWKSEWNVFLPQVMVEDEFKDGKDIFLKYHFADRLPDFFRAVFWCIFRGSSQLAIVTSWKREEYAANAREIMYAVHSILPEVLRKNAGYASFGCGLNQCSSFYFTDTKPEKDYYLVDTQEYVNPASMEDELDHFFYENLATIYWQNRRLYDAFMEQLNDEMKDRSVDKNLLKEVQWMFLQFCIQNCIDIPDFQDMINQFPQLFYRACDSDSLTEIQENLLQYYHAGNWDREDYEKYLLVLENGMSRKGEKKILEEMDWAIDQYSKKHKNLVRDYLNSLSQSKKGIYTKLMVRSFEKEDGLLKQNFQNSLTDFSTMQAAVDSMDVRYISGEMKDQWMLRGIEILNEDVFAVKHFEAFSKMALAIDRKEQWIQILDGFLQQLSERAEQLDDKQLLSACGIEKIYGSLVHDTSRTELMQEKLLRQKSEEGFIEEFEEEENEENIESEEDFEEEVMEEYEEVVRGSFWPVLLRSIPYGFLTGCVLFLLNYSLVIGHWKISVGVGGMWLIMILNYSIERAEMKKKDGYRLWMAIGLCIVEGYIIQTIAWMFLKQNIRIYFFLGLGIFTVLIQLIQLILVRRKMNKGEIEA